MEYQRSRLYYPYSADRALSGARGSLRCFVSFLPFLESWWLDSSESLKLIEIDSNIWLGKSLFHDCQHLLVLKSVKHGFVDFSRNAVECWFVTVQTTYRKPLP